MGATLTVVSFVDEFGGRRAHRSFCKGIPVRYVSTPSSFSTPHNAHKHVCLGVLVLPDVLVFRVYSIWHPAGCIKRRQEMLISETFPSCALWFTLKRDDSPIIALRTLLTESRYRVLVCVGAVLIGQASANGSPGHPSYPAGHAVQNGAFATVLKVGSPFVETRDHHADRWLGEVALLLILRGGKEEEGLQLEPYVTRARHACSPMAGHPCPPSYPMPL